MPMNMKTTPKHTSTASMSQRTRTALGALCALALCQHAEPNHARSESILSDRFQLRLGAFWPELDSQITRTRRDGPGDKLDFERHLNLDENKSTFYGGAAWRINDTHSLDLEYFDLGREGRIVADRSWDIGDTTVLAGATMRTQFDVAITRLSYQYTLSRGNRHRLGFMAGIHHARLEAQLLLSGRLEIDGEPVLVPPEERLAQLDKTDAPLPHFGINYGYAYSPQWSLHTSLIGFSMAIDQYEGSLLEGNASVMYQVNRRLGLGPWIQVFPAAAGTGPQGQGHRVRVRLLGAGAVHHRHLVAVAQ